MRILVMHAGWQGGLACIQSLGRRGHRIDILDQNPATPHRESAYVHRIVPAPYLRQEAAHEAYVEDLVTADAYDLVIPITDADAYLLARIHRRHPSLRNLVLPALEAMETARSKVRATQFARGLGITVPESWFPADMDGVRALLPVLPYPCVVKLPFGFGGQGVTVVASRDALLDRMARAFADGHQPLIQRYIEGTQVNTTIMVNHGTVIGAFACSIRRKHYVGGTAPFASSLADDAPVDLSRRLAAALPWHGAMDVDCMRAADGTLYFLEINPRLSGNAVFGSKLGIDLPARYIDIVEGRAEAPRSYGIPHGRTLCALSDSVIRWVLKDPRRRLLEAVARHLSWRTCTNIFWSDRALVRAHWRQIRSLIRAGG